MAVFPIKQGLFKYEVVDHHAILGAPLDADLKQIRNCYLKIAYLLHPDTAKGKSEAEVRRASKYFSKLVNPAYEHLSREASRVEQLLIATQTAKNLTGEISKLTLVNEDVRELLNARNDLDLVYHRLLEPLTKELYKDLEHTLAKVAHVSELNLVYLLSKSEQPVQPTPRTHYQSAASSATVIQPFGAASAPSPTVPEVQVQPEVAKVPSHDLYFRRAQEYYDREDFNRAIAELRQVLKIDPKDASAHCLLGLSYLKSNMATMAKVHINTASELKPRDPQVILAKRELEKNNSTASSKKTNDKSSNGGLFGGLFGGKKK
ncbi:MAG: J domain-containing protein [Microcystaceae cyanobacterium]